MFFVFLKCTTHIAVNDEDYVTAVRRKTVMYDNITSPISILSAVHTLGYKRCGEMSGTFRNSPRVAALSSESVYS